MTARLALVTVLVAVSLAGARPATAQTAEDLFAVNTMQEIRLSVNSRDLRVLREKFSENTYYPADLTWRNIKVRNVGIRSRGLGSRNGTKLGLRVDMAHYTSGQTFVGLSALVLDNIWQDDTMIRERLAFTMFEQVGLAVPRESFARLYINNEYQGLYAITEEIDADFVRRVTGETDGTLFEYHYLRDWRFEDLGEIATYKPMFEPRTHRLDADSTLYVPIQTLVREANGPDDAVWRERVEQFIDLNQFVMHTAVEAFVTENDGLLGYAGMNNFYLYRQQGTNRHRLFPWDKDNAFKFIDSAIAVTDTNVLFQRAMAYADLREVYLATVEQAARAAAANGFLASEVERLATLIFDAARADTRKQFTNEQFDAGIEYMRQFAARRPAIALDEVARLRRGGS